MPAVKSSGTAARAGSTLAKLAVVATFFAIWSTIYDATNSHGSPPERAIFFSRPCDRFPDVIQPWTAAIYLFGGTALTLTPFLFHWQWKGIRFVLTCYTIAAVVTFTAYWFWPVCMKRPVFEGADVGSRLLRWVQGVDRPANCCPSSHAMFAVLGALLVSHARPGRGLQAAIWFLTTGVCATTITTGQHYFMDVAAGAAVAVGSYVVGRAITSSAPR